MFSPDDTSQAINQRLAPMKWQKNNKTSVYGKIKSFNDFQSAPASTHGMLKIFIAQLFLII